MLKELVILFIYAKDCPDCQEMREIIFEAINNSDAPKNCKVREINSDSDEAIDIALENDVNDLPGCVIGEFSFCGKDKYTYDEILSAINDTWNET